jgi:hypothetical protein
VREELALGVRPAHGDVSSSVTRKQHVAGHGIDGADLWTVDGRRRPAFKMQRSIVNRSYQTTADDIVGTMTIAALDREMFDEENQASPCEVCLMNARGGDIEPSGCASTLPGGSTLNFAIIAQPVAQTLTARDAVLQADVQSGLEIFPERAALERDDRGALRDRRSASPRPRCAAPRTSVYPRSPAARDHTALHELGADRRVAGLPKTSWPRCRRRRRRPKRHTPRMRQTTKKPPSCEDGFSNGCGGRI